jgi:hypothetical protein
MGNYRSFIYYYIFQKKIFIIIYSIKAFTFVAPKRNVSFFAWAFGPDHPTMEQLAKKEGLPVSIVGYSEKHLMLKRVANMFEK